MVLCVAGAGAPFAMAGTFADTPITQRHADVTRERAADAPRKEEDQKLVDGWPMYRTDRGQEAFNAAMATLKVTEGEAPSSSTFKGCATLHCHLILPEIDKRGWIPPGRLWVSPNEYVLIVRSPRGPRGKRKSYRLRSKRNMKLFVFHEFHNSTRNTDVYDTISAHKRSVFVPFYLGKEGVDARGRKFVVIVQTAPYNVVSRHVSNHGNRGTGVEIAKNKWEKLTPVQEKAGLVLASIVKKKAPQLRVIHHRHKEGLPMLRAYKRRVAALRKAGNAPKLRLPFVPSSPKRVARVTAQLGELITRQGVKRIVRVAKTKPLVRKVRKVKIVAVPAPTQARLTTASRSGNNTVAPKTVVASRLPQPVAVRVPAPTLVASGTLRGLRPATKPTLTIKSLIERIFAESPQQ